jgi:7-carboxy-7-deazaguanine synthase
MSINTYPIVETFHSLQGEGYWSGVNAFFIRLAGCDVHCPWCDQKESWSQNNYPRLSCEELNKQVKDANPSIIIITGGEPLMHNLDPLTTTLENLNIPIHLETSGAYPLTGKFAWITFSPKTYKPPHESIYPKVGELKVVIATPEDLEWAEKQAQKVPQQAIKYLQPEWNSQASYNMVYNYTLKHPQWRVSLQTHKFMGVR